MPSYLVETYLARSHAGERAACDRRASSAEDELTRGKIPVRYDRSIYDPEDEICFFVFDAPSSTVVARAAQLAELGSVRVVEAISSGKE